jgi:hypothetical protein
VLLGDEGQVADGVAELPIGDLDADPPVPDDLREILLLATGRLLPRVEGNEGKLIARGSLRSIRYARQGCRHRSSASAGVTGTTTARNGPASLVETCGGIGRASTAEDVTDRARHDQERGGDTGDAHPRAPGVPPDRALERRTFDARRLTGGSTLQICLQLFEVLDVRVHVSFSAAGCRPFSCRTSASRRSPRLTRCRAFSSVHESALATSG